MFVGAASAAAPTSGFTISDAGQKLRWFATSADPELDKDSGAGPPCGLPLARSMQQLAVGEAHAALPAALAPPKTEASPADERSRGQQLETASSNLIFRPEPHSHSSAQASAASGKSGVDSFGPPYSLGDTYKPDYSVAVRSSGSGCRLC